MFRAMRFATGILGHEKADIIHSHLVNDHLVMAAALWFTQSKLPLIRIYYKDSRTGSDRAKSKILIRCRTIAAIVFSIGDAEELQKLGIKERRIYAIDPSVDVNRRFASRRLASTARD